ncbi:MAG: hypothetical protein CMN32_02570 [Saprospirales bacterium]|nr:hypothetical protein [Saprospirales bacterium]
MGPWELYLLFFLVALVYSSVGFGGGSSYLALLALFGVDVLVMRSTSLLCNITVVTGSVFIFYKAGFLNLRKALPLVLASMPMAFLGGYVPVNKDTFKLILGATLVLAGVMTWFSPKLRQLDLGSGSSPRQSNAINAAMGGGIGFLSGMVGIGGGIFLAPLLYLTKWDRPKVIAATSSFFILVNSVFGLGGQMSSPQFRMDWSFALPLMLCVLAGGQIGVRLATRKFPSVYIRKATALLVLYVGLRLLFL